MVFSSLCHICMIVILKHFRADVTSHTERELQEPPTFSRTKPSTKQRRTISSPEATTQFHTLNCTNIYLDPHVLKLNNYLIYIQSQGNNPERFHSLIIPDLAAVFIYSLCFCTVYDSGQLLSQRPVVVCSRCFGRPFCWRQTHSFYNVEMQEYQHQKIKLHRSMM